MAQCVTRRGVRERLKALWLLNVGQFNAVERAKVGPESSWARWHHPAFGLASFLGDLHAKATGGDCAPRAALSGPPFER